MLFSNRIPDPPEQYTHARTLLRLDKAGVNGFREMVRVNFTDQDEIIPEHIHPDAVEICYYFKGTQTYSVAGKAYKLKGGMVFIAYPNEIHSSGNRKQERDGQLFYMIIDTLNNTERFLGLSETDGPSLAMAINSLPRTFYAGPDVKPLFEEIFSVYTEKGPFWQTRLRCCAFNLLYTLIQHSVGQGSQPRVSPEILKTLDYIEDHIYDAGKITVDDMARRVFLSTPQFTSRFLLEIGLSPGKYINRRRMEIARQLLSDGESVTRVAYSLNFASSQHFSSCFRSHNGCSPTQWKKEHQATSLCVIDPHLKR